MSKKSRLLALLLTLLMVVGMLPLAIFADAGSATEGEGTATAVPGSFESKKAALESAGFDVYAYQDFEGFTAGDIPLVDGFVSINVPIKYNSKASLGKQPFSIVNRRGAYEIKSDTVNETANKALYLGASDAAPQDDFFDFLPIDYITQGADLYFSVDFKLGGDYVAVSSVPLFTFITRQTNPKRDHSKVYMTGDGGIYCVDNGATTDILGYVSKTEYTTVSFLSDLQHNKYYLYINNILVTPGGCTFLTTGDNSEDSTIRNTINSGVTYTGPADFRFDGVRVFNIRESTRLEEVFHAGLYFDNLLMAGRVPLSEDAPTTTARNIYTMDLSGVTSGEYITNDTTLIPGTGDVKIRRNGSAANDADKMLQYYTDTDGTWIRYYKEDPDATYTGQGYFTVTEWISNATPGANISYSIKLKAGSEQIKETNILAPITRAANSNQNVGGVKTDGSRNLWLYGNGIEVLIGQIPTDGYITLEMQIVCSAAGGMMYKAYIDGELRGAFTVPILESWWKKNGAALVYNGTTLTPETLVINDFHLTNKYVGGANALVADDLYFSDLSIQYITKYNYAAVSNPLEVKPTGFNDETGIKRYYNGDGTYKTGEFAVDGVRYVAAETGAFVGRVSDGVVPAAYGTYVNWDHATDTSYLVQYKAGSVFQNMLDQSVFNGTIGENYRYGMAIGMPKADGDATLVKKFYGGDRWYHRDILGSVDGARWTGTVEGKKSIVVDIDFMPGETVAWSNLVNIMAMDGNGDNRRDTSVVVTQNKNGAGWLKDAAADGQPFMQMISMAEFTRLSLVLKGPETDADGITYDIYINGVKFVEDRAIYDGENNPAKQLHGVRFGYTNNKMDVYYKNVYAYYGDKPQQYYTENASGALVLGSSGTPVTVSDIGRSGFVTDENGVIRCYDPTTGLPVVGVDNYELDGETYKINSYGAVECNGTNHLPSNNGKCPFCGNKFDGISALYGNSLILGSDVKVVFYLDIDAGKLADTKYKIGFERELAAAEQKTFGESDKVTIDGSDYYKITYAIAAKDVEADVKLQIIDASGETEVNGTVYSYSVAKYVAAVNQKATDTTYTATLKALCNALQTYGKNANAKFNGGTPETVDDTVFNGYTSTVKAGANAATMASNIGVELKNMSLMLESNIKIRLYFTLDASKTTYADFTIKVNGEALTAVEYSGGYYVDYEVVAKELGNAVTFTIGNADGSEFTMVFSATDCAYLMNANDSYTAADKALAKALKAYADAAAAYEPGIAEDTRPANKG